MLDKINIFMNRAHSSLSEYIFTYLLNSVFGETFKLKV